MQNTPTARTRKRKAFSSVRLQDPQLWQRTSWLQSFYVEDKSAFVPVQEYCDTFIKHQGLQCGYRDMWNILKLAFPRVEKVRRGRKYVYWGIRRTGERAGKKSRKQARKASAASMELKKEGTSTRNTESKSLDKEPRDISVQEMHEESHLEDDVSFIVHLGTSRVDVETKSHETPTDSETPATNPADTVMVTLPGNESDCCQDNACGSDVEFDSDTRTVTVTDVSVQTQCPNEEDEFVSSLAESGACADGGASRKSVETQWTGEDVERSTRSRFPRGICVEPSDGLAGFQVKQEPLWDSEDDERPTFLSAEAISSVSKAAEESALPALVPFPAHNPPNGSSIDRLKECISKIPQVSQISEYTILPGLNSRIGAQHSSRDKVLTTGRIHVASTGQSPSPRPVQVSVGTQHSACVQALGFSSLRKKVDMDKQNQETSRFRDRATHRGGLVLSPPNQSDIRMSSGNFQQNESLTNSLRCLGAPPASKEISVGTNTEEVGFPAESVSPQAPISQSTREPAPQVHSKAKLSKNHLSDDKNLLPMIVSVMSYAVPESNKTSAARAQDTPSLTSPPAQSIEGLKDREQALSSESRLRSEIQFLRDGLLEERRLRRTAEAQLSKCLLQLNRQKTVSEQLAEALKPFIFNKQT